MFRGSFCAGRYASQNTTTQTAAALCVRQYKGHTISKTNWLGFLWAHKVKTLIFIAISVYTIVLLEVRLSFYDLCGANESTYVSSTCKKVYVTRKVHLDRSSGSGVKKMSLRAPLSLMSEGMKDFLIVNQAVQEFEIPLNIEGETYISWMTLKFPSSVEGNKRIIKNYRDESKYNAYKKNFGLTYYRRISSPASFYYLIPNEDLSNSVHYRCGHTYVNCSAYSSVNGFNVTYSFPLKDLGNRSVIHDSIIALVKNITSGGECLTKCSSRTFTYAWAMPK